jgi:carbamoyl-phosphate synthase large subunit
LAEQLHQQGYKLLATRGTASRIKDAGIPCETVLKVNEGRPHAVDHIKAGAAQLIIYTPTGALTFSDEKTIRRTALAYGVPCITTISGAEAAVKAVVKAKQAELQVVSLHEIHEQTH